MRRSDRQITNPDEIASILRSASLCHLAMVDDGKPYVVPMNFGYSDGALYFHSASEGRKIEVLRKNPEVCFSVVARHEMVPGERACSWTARFASVTGTGRARIITDREGKEKGLKILMAQYSDDGYDFSEEDLAGVVVIRVEVDSLVGKSSDTETRGPAFAEASAGRHGDAERKGRF